MTAATRQVLPQRRRTETTTITFRIPSTGRTEDYTVSVGSFQPQPCPRVNAEPCIWPGCDCKCEPAEVFVSGAKAGSGVEAVARDAAVLLSIALQCGVALETIKHSITREQNGAPSSVMGAIVDHLSHDQRQTETTNRTPSRREHLLAEVSAIVREVIGGKPT